jgi:hypothetical protein
MVVWLKNISSEGGSEVENRQPPPSRVSSEGGSRGVVVEDRRLPLSRFQVREGVGEWWWKTDVSLCLTFE